MLSASDHAAIARRLLQARRSRTAVDTGDLAATALEEGDAYAIQAAVCGLAGPVGAWKTGRKSPDAVPVMAPILASMVRPSPARFAAAELRLIGIELELAFRVEADLPDAGADDYAERAAGCVSVLAAIEVVDSRLAEFEAADALWRLADNQTNGGLVVGEAEPDWGAVDVTAADVELEINGRRVFAARSPVPGGSAFHTFCAFARRVGNHCGGLRRGHVVTTGTLTGMEFVDPGSEVVGRIAGLGEVRVAFDAA